MSARRKAGKRGHESNSQAVGTFAPLRKEASCHVVPPSRAQEPGQSTGEA